MTCSSHISWLCLLIFVSLLHNRGSATHIFLLSCLSNMEFSMYYFCSSWVLITSVTLKAGNNKSPNVLPLHDKTWQREKGVIPLPTPQDIIWITEGWDEGDYIIYNCYVKACSWNGKLEVNLLGKHSYWPTYLTHVCALALKAIFTEPQLCAKHDVSCVFLKCKACLGFRKTKNSVFKEKIKRILMRFSFFISKTGILLIPICNCFKIVGIQWNSDQVNAL